LYGEHLFRQERIDGRGAIIIMRADVILDNEAPNFLDVFFKTHENVSIIGEIGFGNGEFLVHLAKKDPEKFYFGFEVSRTCLMKCQAKVEREGLDNVYLLSGDARFLLRECFPDGVFEGIYMNFPCPWPKKRHEKRRVTAGFFPDVLAAVLILGGFFELATDDEEYAFESRQILSRHQALSFESHEINPERAVMTKYERKWTAEGKTIHVVRFRKEKPWTVKRISEGRASEMHLESEGAKPDMRLLSTFNDTSGGSREQRWIFKNCFEGSDGTFLLETMTADEEFQQHFYIKIVPREGKSLIKFDPATKPLVTPAVKKAMQELRIRMEEIQ